MPLELPCTFLGSVSPDGNRVQINQGLAQPSETTALAPKHLSDLRQIFSASLPLFGVSAHLKVCPSLETPAPVPPHSTSQISGSPGVLRLGLGTHLICCLQLGVKLAEDLLQVLADDVSQHIQPAPGARRGWDLTWHRGRLPQPRLASPCSLPTWDLPEPVCSLKEPPSPVEPKSSPVLSSSLSLQDL